jgi:hypothetical protein
MNRSATVASRTKHGGRRVTQLAAVEKRSSGQTFAIWLALGAAFTSPWTAVRIAGINVADFLLVAATLSALLVAVREGRRLPIFLWAALPPFALLVIAVVNSVVRDHSLWSQRMTDDWVVGSAAGAGYGGAVPLILRMALAITAVAAIVAGAAETSGDGRMLVERIIRFWAIGAAVSAVYGVISFTLFDNRSPLSGTPFLYHVIAETRAAGLATHPNSFGQSIAVALPVLIYMIGVRRGLGRFATIALVVVSFYGIVLSGSRADIALGSVLAAATVLCLVLTGRKLRPWVPLALAVSLPLGMLIAPAMARYLRFGSRSAELSTSERTASLETGLTLFDTNPLLGAGVGSWGDEMVPLIVLTSGGVLFFVIFYGSLARPLYRRSGLPGTSFTRILTISALGVLAFGLLNNAIVERYLYWPFAALFALSLLNDSRHGDKTATENHEGRGIRSHE